MALFVLLSLEYPTGGFIFIKMSVWLPFADDINQIVEAKRAKDSDGIMLFGDAERSTNVDTVVKVVDFVTGIISIDETDSTNNSHDQTCLKTPKYHKLM